MDIRILIQTLQSEKYELRTLFIIKIDIQFLPISTIQNSSKDINISSTNSNQI
jgi:hypothetical protein